MPIGQYLQGGLHAWRHCGYLFYPVEESGYEMATRFAHVGAWLDRVRAIPGWADPCDILPGERLVPKW